jgi:hypothetical protein
VVERHHGATGTTLVIVTAGMVAIAGDPVKTGARVGREPPPPAMEPGQVVGGGGVPYSGGIVAECSRTAPEGLHEDRRLASTRDRADLTRRLVCLAFVAGLLAAHRLYLSRPFYPLTPVTAALPPIPFPLEHVLLAALLGCLAAAAIGPWFRRFAVAALALALGLAAWDQSRWQPWFYQYLLMLVALLASRDERSPGLAVVPHATRTPGAGGAGRVARRGGTVPGPAGARGDDPLDACRLVVASLYLWSGLQKVNVTFARIVFPWLVEPLAPVLPSGLIPWLPATGIAAALVEVAIGIGLLTRRLRPAAVGAAVAMHAIVLLLLGPLGHGTNAVIWPWNVAMAILAVVLFWRADTTARRIAWPRRPGIHAAIALLVLLTPILSFAGLGDAYLSGALYSANVQEAVMLVSPAMRDRLPGDIRRHVSTNRAGLDVLVFADWSLAELGVPPYPEPRVYRSVARAVCAYAPTPSEAELIIFGRPHPWTGVRETIREDCAALRRR